MVHVPSEKLPNWRICVHTEAENSLTSNFVELWHAAWLTWRFTSKTNLLLCQKDQCIWFINETWSIHCLHSLYCVYVLTFWWLWTPLSCMCLGGVFISWICLFCWKSRDICLRLLAFKNIERSMWMALRPKTGEMSPCLLLTKSRIKCCSRQMFVGVLGLFWSHPGVWQFHMTLIWGDEMQSKRQSRGKSTQRQSERNRRCGGVSSWPRGVSWLLEWTSWWCLVLSVLAQTEVWAAHSSCIELSVSHSLNWSLSTLLFFGVFFVCVCVLRRLCHSFAQQQQTGGYQLEQGLKRQLRWFVLSLLTFCLGRIIFSLLQILCSMFIYSCVFFIPSVDFYACLNPWYFPHGSQLPTINDLNLKWSPNCSCMAVSHTVMP